MVNLTSVEIDLTSSLVPLAPQELRMSLMTSPLLGYTGEHVDITTPSPGVMVITFRNPERKCPLTFESYIELGRIFRALADPFDEVGRQIQVVVLIGAEHHVGDRPAPNYRRPFGSGGDVDEIIGAQQGQSVHELLSFTMMTSATAQAVADAPQLVIAAIDDVCVGGSAAIAAACYTRFVTTESRFIFPFRGVGLSPCDMGAYARVAEICGEGHANRWFIEGTQIKSPEAIASGLAHAVPLVESGRVRDPSDLPGDGRELNNRVLAYAAHLAEGPAFGTRLWRMTRQMMTGMDPRSRGQLEAYVQTICMLHPNYREFYVHWQEHRGKGGIPPTFSPPFGTPTTQD